MAIGKGGTLGILAIIALVAAGYAINGGVVTQRETAAPGDFTLTISTTAAEIVMGERPQLNAVLTNNSGKTVDLVPALDGSDGMRSPIVKFNIARPANAPAPSLGRCGNTNNIGPGDFVRVPAGGTFSPIGAWGGAYAHEFTAPGVYTLQLTYDTQGSPAQWYGFMGPIGPVFKADIRRRLAKVPKMHLQSNSVQITVVAAE